MLLKKRLLLLSMLKTVELFNIFVEMVIFLKLFDDEKVQNLKQC